MASFGKGSFVLAKHGFRIAKKENGRVIIGEWVTVKEEDVGVVIDVIRGGYTGTYIVKFVDGIVTIKGNNLKPLPRSDEQMKKEILKIIDSDNDPKEYENIEDAEY